MKTPATGRGRSWSTTSYGDILRDILWRLRVDAAIMALMSTPMKFFVCPKCEQRSITVRDKYLSGHWLNIYCPACGARLFAEPIILALVYMGYFWAVAWFVSWGMLKQDWSLVLYLIPVWLIIDALSLAYLPLRVMRPKAAAPRD